MRVLCNTQGHKDTHSARLPLRAVVEWWWLLSINLSIHRSMADGNIGQQAASAVDAKIQEFQALQEGIGQSKQKLGTLMAQRNEVRVVLA